MGKYIQTGLKEGRNSFLNNYGSTGEFDGSKFAIGFGASTLSKYTLSKSTKNLTNKLIEGGLKNYYSGVSDALISGENFDFKDVITDSGWTMIGSFASRLATH